MKRKKPREREDPDNTWNMQFMAACKSGDRNEMEVLIEKGAQVDHVVREGEAENGKINTPYLARARAGDADIMRHLVSLGADVNHRMEHGYTALHYAVMHDMNDVAEVALELHTDTTLKDFTGHTPMQLAIAKAKVEMAQVLLKHGAHHDFKERGHSPYTQTQQACVSGDMATLDTLLELGESIYQRDADGNTLLHLAAINEHRGIVEELLARRANINSTNVTGCTPLWLCVEEARLEELTFLVGKGATVSTQNALGMPLLQYAIVNSDPEVVGRLVELGANVSERDAFGNTPMHWAAAGVRLEMVELLLEARTIQDPKAIDVAVPEVNHPNKEGGVPLHKACYWGREDIVKLLLSKEADPNAKDSQGRAPLHDAAEMGHLEVVKSLLQFEPLSARAHQETKRRAAHKRHKKEEEKDVENPLKPTEIDAEDHKGLTALQAAMAVQHTNVVEALLGLGASVVRVSPPHGPLLHHAIHSKNEAIVAAVVHANADVNLRDDEGRTPLHVAVHYELRPVARLLVECGAEKDAQDIQQSWTSLHMLCASKNTLMAEDLIQAGCSVNVEDSNQCTPLHICGQSGAADIAAVVIQNGGDVNAREKHQRTPLHVACEASMHAVAAVLIQEGAEVEAKDTRGWAPLHVAVFSGCTEATALLVQGGCRLNDADYSYRTPLMLASQTGKVECARLLVMQFKESQQSQPRPTSAGSGASEPRSSRTSLHPVSVQ